MTTISIKNLMVSMTAAASIGFAGVTHAEDPIRIGGIYILSGSAATYGEFAQKGIDLAVQEINASGGILGGLAGLSGALPAMWCALRPWPRHETRAVLQPFNVVILMISASLLALRGAYTAEVLPALGLAVLVSVLSGQVGIFVFKRLSDDQFRWLVILLMLASGLMLLLRTVVFPG